MIILVGLSPIFSPALLRVLAPLVSSSEVAKVDVTKIVVTLLLGQVLPLLTGLAVHRWCPRLAARLLGPAEKGGKILNAAFLFSFSTLSSSPFWRSGCPVSSACSSCWSSEFPSGGWRVARTTKIERPWL